ncbi:cell surface protein, partial [Streptococcus suis]
KPILTKPIEDNATSGYEIGFTLQQIGEVKPWNTFRIVFKEDHDGFIYALEFSGQAAFLKKLSSIDAPLQSGEKYAETSHILGSEEHKVRLVVKGNSVTV